MRTTTGWAISGTQLEKTTFDRRDLRADDLAVRVDFCGVCHSDLHVLHGVYGQFPGVVPGHEFTGVVTEVGPDVQGFTVGDRVAVGTIVDSCGQCPMCTAGQENFCEQHATLTYAGTDRIDGTPTQGGYSREHVVRSEFAYPLPAALDPAAAAPLLCAGITVYEPLRAAGIGAGSRVAVAGLGGLGHLGVKFAAALGAEVTVLSRTTDKEADAKALGASALQTYDDAGTGSFDLILDTVSAEHDLAPLIGLLAPGGTLSVLGHLLPTSVPIMALAMGRKKLSSSGTGGRRETAAMLAFAAEHGIVADVEVAPSSQVNEVLERLERGDVRYRFVLDLADLD